MVIPGETVKDVGTNERPVGLKTELYPGGIVEIFIIPGLDTDMRFIAPVSSPWFIPPRVGVLGWP